MGRLLYWTKKVLLWPFRPVTRLARDWLAGFIHTYFYEALDHARRLNQLLETAPAQIDARVRTVEDLIRTSDSVLLAVLRALPQPHESTAFRAAPLGDGWLLAPHPWAKFIYLDANDHTQTPHIVAGLFEMGVTLALLNYLVPNSVLWEPTPRTGYHVLTAQHKVTVGQIVIAPPPTTERDVLRRNMSAKPSPNVVWAEKAPPQTTIVRLELPTDANELEPWLTRNVVIIVGYSPSMFDTAQREALLAQLTQAQAAGRSIRVYEDGQFIACDGQRLNWSGHHCCLVFEPAKG